jgi:hypothetical protein
MASTANSSAASGTEVIVPFRIDNLSGKPVTSYQFDIEYDARVIAPAQLAADIAGTMSEGLSVVSNVPARGMLKVAVYGALPVTGDGIYVNLKFRVLGVAGSSSPVAITAFGFNDGTLEAAAVSGRVTVTDSDNDTKLSGRVLTSAGQPVAGAQVTITNTSGQTRSAVSDASGKFVFNSIVIGETYRVEAGSKRNRFAPVSVSVSGVVTDLDMIAEQ